MQFTVTIQTRGGSMEFHRHGESAAGTTARHFRALGYPTVVTDVHGTPVDIPVAPFTPAEQAHYDQMAAAAQHEEVNA